MYVNLPAHTNAQIRELTKVLGISMREYILTAIVDQVEYDNRTILKPQTKQSGRF